MKKTKINEFLDAPLTVINIGLETFADELEEQGVPVVHLDWAPPARGNPKLAALLSKLGA
ncbi:MAG: fdrA domain protein [Magnetovibrio sp.]|nr:fdrA domain protein [Magnetovibrio sp.]|tara:strand:- start:151 stop:330 length:180 start_codon:yes stop_codon:yes gene_type:complete